jgi:UDP-2,3-diacylglucosamine pyrophosphatase LpxH
VILDIDEERLFVVSDLHLGNPASTAETRILSFLDHVAACGASLCINGDGFDMLQTSFGRLARSGLPVLTRLRRIQAAGGNVYYVVGNHDLVFEHFLDHLLVFRMAPFLNVRSGDARIRVEHGHLYDPFFVRAPRTYAFITRVGGLFLLVHGDVYRWWNRGTEAVARWRRRRTGDEVTSPFHAAAELLLERGFDTVVFGHTHRAEVVTLPSGTYVNGGDWMTGRTYVEIDHGVVRLRSWDDLGWSDMVPDSTADTRTGLTAALVGAEG